MLQLNTFAFLHYLITKDSEYLNSILHSSSSFASSQHMDHVYAMVGDLFVGTQHFSGAEPPKLCSSWYSLSLPCPDALIECKVFDGLASV